MGLSSLYGTWEKEHFAAPSIIESYEPDRTKVTVEFEPDDSELGVKTSEVGVIDSEVGEKIAEVGEKTAELGEKNQEVGEKNSEVTEKTSEVKEKIAVSDDVKPVSDDVNHDFEVLMGAYRNDFRDNARRVFSAITDDPGIDTTRLSQTLGISENSVWRAIRAMKEVGLLVREGGDKGGKWIVKKVGL
jgi:predicted HTH transcriptional regulator